MEKPESKNKSVEEKLGNLRGEFKDFRDYGENAQNAKEQEHMHIT